MKNSTAVVLAALVAVSAGVSALLTKPDCTAWNSDERKISCNGRETVAPRDGRLAARPPDSVTAQQAGRDPSAERQGIER